MTNSVSKGIRQRAINSMYSSDVRVHTHTHAYMTHKYNTKKEEIRAQTVQSGLESNEDVCKYRVSEKLSLSKEKGPGRNRSC